MFKVITPQGDDRYMVQLVGPASYRMGNLRAWRGQTLPVTKRTRDYLVRKTNGAWQDFDPAPQEPVEELMPPQFGEEGGPMIDMEDIDPSTNPPLSMEHAMALAAKGQGGEVPTNGPIYAEGADVSGIDPADLNQKPMGSPDVPDESGDMTSADLGKGGAKKATGGATAGSTAKAAGKTGVKFTTKATPKADASADPEVAQTVS